MNTAGRIFFSCVYSVPLLYGLWRVMPYVLFYLLPFMFFSLILASVWMLVIRRVEEHPSSLGLVVPVTFAVVFLCTGSPKEPRILKNGAIAIESAFLFELFNAAKVASDGILAAIVPFKFLAPKIPSPKVLYDFNDVRWLLWLSFGLGAPWLFAVCAKKQIDSIAKTGQAKYEEIVAAKQDELAKMHKELSNETRNARAFVDQMKTERDHFRSEHAKLKMLFEFQKKATSATTPGKREITKPKGVLDSDLL